MFQFDWSSQNSPGQHLLCWSTSSHPQWFFLHFFLGSSPAKLSPMPSFHHSSLSSNHSDSFASSFLSMLVSGSFVFQEKVDEMVEADQFMMRLHLQLVPQPPLGRGGPCEAITTLFVFSTIAKVSMFVSVSVSVPKSTSISKSTHSFGPALCPPAHSVFFGNCLMHDQVVS